MSKLLNIQHWKTTQNVPVYFVHTPEIPMLDLRMVFNAGTTRDGEKAGVANLMSCLLDEGTRRLNADEVAKQLDAVGALFQCSVRADSSYLSLRTLTDPIFLNQALDIFTQVLSEPAFAPDAIERVRKQVLIGLEEEMQQPAAIAQHLFYRTLYPAHPYGQPLSGSIASVQQLTREDVMDFYTRYYVANNALLVLVGDITQPHAQDIAEKLVSSLAAGSLAPALEMAPNVPAASTSIHFPSQQTTICLGQVGIAMHDPDYFPLMVGNYTLGGGGMVSRLFHEIREQKGLVYGIHSGFMPLLARGPFSISLQTRNEEANNAVELTLDVLRKFVKHGPTNEELIAAQKNIIGGFPLELAGNGNILIELVRMGFYHLPLDYLDTYRDKVAAVTQAQICDAFQQHVQVEEMVKVMVGESKHPQ